MIEMYEKATEFSLFAFTNLEKIYINKDKKKSDDYSTKRQNI